MNSVTAFETIINAQRQRIDDLEALLKAQTQISQHLHEEHRKLETQLEWHQNRLAELEEVFVKPSRETA